MKKQQWTPAAVACIRGGGEYPNLSGTVKFYDYRGGTLVAAEIRGLPESGFFGFHIHEGCDCSGKAFSDTGGHYNPEGSEHPGHEGDLPPLLSNCGQALLQVWTCRFRVCEVIGRTVIIHSQPDDFQSQPSGNAGSKIGCGVICAL